MTFIPLLVRLKFRQSDENLLSAEPSTTKLSLFDISFLDVRLPPSPPDVELIYLPLGTKQRSSDPS